MQARHVQDESSNSSNGPPVQFLQAGGVTAAPRLQAGSHDLVQHGVFLVLALAVVALAFALRVPGEDKVYLPFWNDVALPGLCYSRQLFGVSCPGCGMTRCFISLAHGQLSRAWHFNPAGFLLFGLVLCQIPYRTAQIWRIGYGKETIRLWGLNLFFYLLLAVLLAQWLPGAIQPFL